MQETFERTAVTVGDSVGFTIPAYLIQNSKVVKGQKYTITISDEALGE